MRGLRRLATVGVLTAIGCLAACAPPPVPRPPSEFATELQEIAALEATFCPDGQQRLVGLDESTMPIESIGNVTHSEYTSFVAAKASLSPLETQTYRVADPVADPDGGTVWVNHRISCKMRSSDHVATAGYPTQPDLPCQLLNQRSLDLAWDRLSIEERDAYTADGLGVALQPDLLEASGPEWLADVEDEVVNGDTLELTAHALLIDFFDPAYAAYPETIRGVHYCTVWTPAWAYAWYRVNAFQP